VGRDAGDPEVAPAEEPMSGALLNNPEPLKTIGMVTPSVIPNPPRMPLVSATPILRNPMAQNTLAKPQPKEKALARRMVLHPIAWIAPQGSG
jgi:hypothetical protein